jgi:hypothetical protein
MAKDPKPMEDLSANAKLAIDRAEEQAFAAVDVYFDFLKKTISSCPSGGTDLGEMVKIYADKNIAATREYIKQLSQVKDFQDAVRIQTQFMQAQLEDFAQQTKNLGEAATGEFKSPFKTSLAWPFEGWFGGTKRAKIG